MTETFQIHLAYVTLHTASRPCRGTNRNGATYSVFTCGVSSCSPARIHGRSLSRNAHARKFRRYILVLRLLVRRYALFPLFLVPFVLSAQLMLFFPKLTSLLAQLMSLLAQLMLFFAELMLPYLVLLLLLLVHLHLGP